VREPGGGGALTCDGGAVLRLCACLLALVALGARAESVSLSISAPTPCVNDASLRRALRAAGLELVASGGLDVDVSPMATGAGVRLRARRTRDARLLVRVVPLRGAGDGCQGLELALVTLIREWASAPQLAVEQPDAGMPGRATPRGDSQVEAGAKGRAPDFEPDAGPMGRAPRDGDVDAGPKRRAPRDGNTDAGAKGLAQRDGDADAGAMGRAPRDGDGAGAKGRAQRDGDGAGATGRDGDGDAGSMGRAPRNGDSELDAGPRVRAREGDQAGPANAGAGSMDAGAAAVTPFDAGIELAGSAADAGGASPETSWEVRGAFSAGVSSMVGTPVTPMGAVVVDVGSGLFGASLDGAFDANVTLISAPGQLVFSTQSITLSARLRFAVSRFSFDVGLGARGLRISAAASGFSTNGTAALLSVGPALSGTVWVRLLGPLLLMVRGSGALRIPADDFVVTNGPTFKVGNVQVGVVLGLAIAWP
jgi:hypothetical protein